MHLVRRGIWKLLTPKGPSNPKWVFAISGSLDEGVEITVFAYGFYWMFPTLQGKETSR